nr:molybdenum ABC transporter ATP-binding protein [Ramlibacter humi]
MRLAFDRAGFRLDVDLALPDRGITVLFGPSGCGKTTLLRCVAGLERARGRVEVTDECWQDDAAGTFLPAWRRRVGYVFQEASLFPHLTVAGNLAYARKRAGHGAGAIAHEQVVELLGIAHLLDRDPAGLSGGERQRVAIARALATHPKLLLLDEPLAAIDPARRREVLPWLENLRDALGLPMLYVTHSADEMARLADTLVLMEAGRAVASGPLTEVLARLDLPVARDEEAGALLEGTVAEQDERWHLARVDFGGGSLWLSNDGLPTGRRVRVRVLARDVSMALERPAPGTASIQNVLRCTVAGVAPGSHPSQVVVRLDCGGHALLARVTARAADQLALAPGREAWAQVKSVGLVR